MILNRRRLLYWWLPALALTLLSGCAGKTRPVVFTPTQLATPASGQLPEDQLRQLPPATLAARGDRYLAQDNLQMAELHYRQALSREPGSTNAQVGLGRVLLRQNRNEAAKTLFAQVLEQEPDNLAALAASGRIHRLRGECDSAEADLRRALQLRPQSPEILTELALCSSANGEPDAAEGWYRQVIELLPDNPAGYNNLGVNYLVQERYPQAVAAFRQALARAPQDRQIQNNLAAAYLLAGHDREGLALFRKSVGGPAAYNNAGYLYLVQKKWRQAELAFNKALELSPNYYVRAADNLEFLQGLHPDDGRQPNPVE